MIKAIIFDLWNTLGSKGAAVAKELQEYCNIPAYTGYITDYEKSIQLINWSSKQEMAKNFLKSFKIKQTDENISFIVSTCEKGIADAKLFHGMKELLIRLKKDYVLGTLSNTTIFESQVLKIWGIERLFDAQAYSWQIGSLKPAKRNFDEICNRLKVNSSECLFIDDGITNIDSARSYGFNVIKYENMDQLCRELKQMGVI